MGRRVLPALGGQGRPLGYPEAVLLVSHDEGQVGKLHPIGDEGVGAHHKADLPPGQGGPGLYLLGGGHGAGEQAHPHLGGSQEGGQGLEVLFRQHLGGGHQGPLTAAPGAQPPGVGRHHRLA